MYSIVIERSQPVMQVARIDRCTAEAMRPVANEMYGQNIVEDYDVLTFASLENLNDFLMENLKK